MLLVGEQAVKQYHLFIFLEKVVELCGLEMDKLQVRSLIVGFRSLVKLCVECSTLDRADGNASILSRCLLKKRGGHVNGVDFARQFFGTDIL